MISVLTRRAVAAAVCVPLCRGRTAGAQALGTTQPFVSDVMPARDALAALEARHGGRLGVVALDTGSGRRIGYRPGERFAMCSTHKFLTRRSPAILTLVDQGRMTLGRRVPAAVEPTCSNTHRLRCKNVDAGFMTVDALCAAIMEWSDNTAANLLLALIGGPPAWNRYARSIGDRRCPASTASSRR